MPSIPILCVAIAIMVYLMIHKRVNLTLDAAWKKFNNDPNWEQNLGHGVFEDMLR